MSGFELVRFGCGGSEHCPLKCGGPNSCRIRMSGALSDAVRKARELIDCDPLNVVEVRQGRKLVCTVGSDWTSRPVS